MSSTNSNNANGSDTGGDDAHPVTSICDRIKVAFKGERWTEVLGLYEELLTLEGLEDEVDLLPVISKAWGRAVEAAGSIGGGDMEHKMEMVFDFEERFGFVSPYLAALSSFEPTAVDTLAALHARFGYFSTEIVDGVLDRFPKQNPDELRGMLLFLKEKEFDLPPEIVERLEKGFAFRAKNEDPEAILEEMLDCGMKPTLCFIFNFIFSKKGELKRPPMDYYEQMLGYGIRPVESTFRLLSKHPLLSKEDAGMMRRRLQGNARHETKYMEQLRLCHTEGRLEEAEGLVRRMDLEGITIDKYIYNELLSCCRQKPEMADKWYQKMIESGVEPNTVTFSNLMNVYREGGKGEEAGKWLEELRARGLQPDHHNYVALMECYTRSNSRGKAAVLFKEVLENSVLPDGSSNHDNSSVNASSSSPSTPKTPASANGSNGGAGKENSITALIQQGMKGGGGGASTGSGGGAAVFTPTAPPSTSTGVGFYNCVMKMGPFDWSVGCLALFLAEGFNPKGPTRSVVQSLAKDDVAHEMIGEMNRCGWDRDNLLRSEMLVSPPKGTTPSFVECMRFMMRDLKMDPAFIELKTVAFNREVESAFDRKPRPKKVPLAPEAL